MFKRAAESLRTFNAKPPTWAYWIVGIVIVLVVQSLRFL